MNEHPASPGHLYGQLSEQQMQEIIWSVDPVVAVVAASAADGTLSGSIVEFAEAAGRIGRPEGMENGPLILAIEGSNERPPRLCELEEKIKHCGGLDQYASDLSRVLDAHKKAGRTPPHEWWFTESGREPTAQQMLDKVSVDHDLPLVPKYTAVSDQHERVSVLSPGGNLAAGQLSAGGWPVMAPTVYLEYLWDGVMVYWDVIIVGVDVEQYTSECRREAWDFWADHADAVYLARNDGILSLPAGVGLRTLQDYRQGSMPQTLPQPEKLTRDLPALARHLYGRVFDSTGGTLLSRAK